jgi:hypothetical protein
MNAGGKDPYHGLESRLARIAACQSHKRNGTNETWISDHLDGQRTDRAVVYPRLAGRTNPCLWVQTVVQLDSALFGSHGVRKDCVVFPFPQEAHCRSYRVCLPSLPSCFCLQLPRYCELVPQPMWFKEIEKRKKKVYTPNEEGLQRLEEDFRLIGANAVLYNTDYVAYRQREWQEQQQRRLAQHPEGTRRGSGGGGAAQADGGPDEDELKEHEAVRQLGEQLVERTAVVFKKVRQDLHEDIARGDSEVRLRGQLMPHGSGGGGLGRREGGGASG